MSTKLFFTLTERERDALLTLKICRAAWRTFDPRTWASLAAKGLVSFGVAPATTSAGSLAVLLTMALRDVNKGSDEFSDKLTRPATLPASDARPAA